MTKRKIAGTVADPTLPKTPVTIGEKTYSLCFDFGALAEAETAINADLLRARSDYQVNLLNALPTQNLANTRILFAAALRTFHPEIDFDEACKMPDAPALFTVASAIRDAWVAAMPAPEQAADPTQPGE